MNKSESKYFNTAKRMDEAFLELLAVKDFEYITVKEICGTAVVNRSTFYLHYETIADLLSECVEYINGQFLEYMQKDSEMFVEKIEKCSLEELYLLTPEYLIPYLNYIRDNKKLFLTATQNAAVLQLENTYSRMFRHIFAPIMDRFNIPEHDRHYILAFYIKGIMAVIVEWLKCNCEDPVEYIADIIRKYAREYEDRS